MSCLLKTLRNTITKDSKQNAAVSRLVKLLHHTTVLKHFECTGLRNVTGQEWLPCLTKQVALRSLNLSGCTFLQPDLLREYLAHSSVSLHHLYLNGCSRVGGKEVIHIGSHQRVLRSLSLGGCSQTIGSEHIGYLLQQLQQLRHLDMQALNHIGEFQLSSLPQPIRSIDFSSCQRMWLRPSEQSLGDIFSHRENMSSAPVSGHRLQYIKLDALGSPRIGLQTCTLTYFALGRCLREVHLTGCEQVMDWEVQVLAETCSQTLTVFQMRATKIGNQALVALATHCLVLAECDVSACFRVTDEGVEALCRNEAGLHNKFNGKKRRCRSTLRSLKIASLPSATNRSVSAISRLDALHLLDIHDCPQVTSSALCQAILQLPHLIDINAKGISEDQPESIARSLTRSAGVPVGLKFVNQRALLPSAFSNSCCSVRENSQRLTNTIPLQYMYHCVDCGLMPWLSRGICSCCVTKCHKAHTTFLGSWTRFYCDCPFAVATNECTAMFDPKP
eukprot:scaffold25296_cov162-Cylindrotheca_fusiformis.AAC.1